MDERLLHITVNGGEIIKVSHSKPKDIGIDFKSKNNILSKIKNNFLYFQLFNELIPAPPRAAQVVTPEMLLKQILGSLRDGTYSEKLKGIPMERLFLHLQTYYEKYKQDPTDTQSLEVAKAFSNLIYLLDPDYKKEAFENTINAITHAWLEYIPRTIKAARPLKSIPGAVIERLSIPTAAPATDTKEIIELPAKATTAIPAVTVDVEFNVDDLKNAKYKYNIAEFSFVLRDYSTTFKYLMIVLDTPYMNIDATNLLVQNSIFWSEELMQKNDYKEALSILSQIKERNMDKSTAELINDKAKEATVLYKITLLEEKCPLNEKAVGAFVREKIGYKKFLRLTYFIFGNIEFHQRLEDIRIFPKKMIYPLLAREPTQRTEELIVKRHEQHDKLIRKLYEWFWDLDVVKHYLSDSLKEEITEKFGEYGSGPVIYFRYISKGQYANIMISKAVALVGQGKVQKAKKELYSTYELTGSSKIKGYLDFLRQHEKAEKALKKKKKMTRKMVKVTKK